MMEGRRLSLSTEVVELEETEEMGRLSSMCPSSASGEGRPRCRGCCIVGRNASGVDGITVVKKVMEDVEVEVEDEGYIYEGHAQYQKRKEKGESNHGAPHPVLYESWVRG